MESIREDKMCKCYKPEVCCTEWPVGYRSFLNVFHCFVIMACSYNMMRRL